MPFHRECAKHHFNKTDETLTEQLVSTGAKLATATRELAAAKAQVAELTRERDDFARALVRAHEHLLDKEPHWKDWACAECRPNSDALIADFRCEYHKALARIRALEPEEET